MSRSIGTSIPELYRSVDTNGIILDCNHAYAERLGYSLDEIIGISFYEHTPEEHRHRLKASFEEWQKTEAHAAGRIFLETESGEQFEVMLAVEAWYNHHNQLGGRNATMREISHLEEMRKMYDISSRAEYENPDVMYRSVNYNGIIIDTNQTYLDKLGYTKEEVIGVNLLHHTADRSKGNIASHMENWRNGIHDNSNIWMRRKDGSEFPVSLTATDERSLDGTLVGRTVALKPIDE